MSNKTTRRSYSRQKLTRAQRLRKRSNKEQRAKTRAVHDEETVALEKAEYQERLRVVREELEARNLSLSGRFRDEPAKAPNRNFIEAILGLMGPRTVSLNPCLRSAEYAKTEGRLVEQMGLDLEELFEGDATTIRETLYGEKVVKEKEE